MNLAVIVNFLSEFAIFAIPIAALGMIFFVGVAFLTRFFGGSQ